MFFFALNGVLEKWEMCPWKVLEFFVQKMVQTLSLRIAKEFVVCSCGVVNKGLHKEFSANVNRGLTCSGSRKNGGAHWSTYCWDQRTEERVPGEFFNRLRKGHFGVRKSLAFKTRISAKPFLWQWMYSSMYISMTSHWASRRNRALGQLGNGLSNDVFERCTSTGRGLFSIFGRWFCPNFQSNRLYKSKKAKQYKVSIVKAC